MEVQGGGEAPAPEAPQEDAMEETRIARMIRELQSDLADLVAAGEMSPEQANEWANAKADQWAGGLG